ncbi:MAG: hypothetical protein LUF85_01130 [Bacteroides sp.]|nr:hypothetical protein [Bacteroides sp.]
MADKMVRFLRELFQSFLSIVKILLFSRRATPVKDNFRNREELVILANGPSLNTTLERAADFLRDKTLLAVNFGVLSPVYEKVRPELYLIADPLFWTVPEKRVQLFGTLAEKTTWPLNLLVPARAWQNKEWQPLLAGNPHIRLCLYNTTPIEGFQGLCNFIFRRGWGVPRPHNVLIPCITIGLGLPFRCVYLAGADHSWLPEISVTDRNEVMMHQKHFYDQGTSRSERAIEVDQSTTRLHKVLYHMYVAFSSYFVLEAYARKLGKEVINITPGSYIDAFKRMKV